MLQLQGNNEMYALREDKIDYIEGRIIYINILIKLINVSLYILL
jgi:hypothetical protein